MMMIPPSVPRARSTAVRRQATTSPTTPPRPQPPTLCVNSSPCRRVARRWCSGGGGGGGDGGGGGSGCGPTPWRRRRKRRRRRRRRRVRRLAAALPAPRSPPRRAGRPPWTIPHVALVHPAPHPPQRPWIRTIALSRTPVTRTGGVS